MGREEELRYECFQTVWTATSRLLTPQTSALGMRDGAGNVPEPPAPARWASPARVDRPLRHGTERGARCRKDGRADRRRPRNSRRAFPSHDLSPPGTKRGPGGLKSETPLPLLDEALLSLPKFFSIKRSHRQRRVCAGPASRPATRLPPLSPPLRAETASEPAPPPAAPGQQVRTPGSCAAAAAPAATLRPCFRRPVRVTLVALPACRLSHRTPTGCARSPSHVLGMGVTTSLP